MIAVENCVFGKKKQAQPPLVRDTLFGDCPLDAWPADGSPVIDVFPWSAFVAGRKALRDQRPSDARAFWREVLEHPDLESRHHLQAWHFLRLNGEQPSPDIAKRVLGVVIEVAMPKGLDTLAAYADHSARYFNYSGAVVIWERPDDSLDPSTDELLAVAGRVVTEIGPWEEARPGPPARGQARLSFLTPSGLHFGHGALGHLSIDPLGGAVLRVGTRLMQELMGKIPATSP